MGIDDEPFETSKRFTAELSRGVHKITFRVALGETADQQLKLELFKVKDSAAEFAVVDGQ